MGYLQTANGQAILSTTGSNRDGDRYEFTKHTEYQDRPVFYSDPDTGHDETVVPRYELFLALAGLAGVVLGVLGWLVSALMGA